MLPLFALLALAASSSSGCARADAASPDGGAAASAADREARTLQVQGQELERLLKAGRLAEAARLAATIPDPREKRPRFYLGHLLGRVAEAMAAHRGPERPALRVSLLSGQRVEVGSDLCGAGARAWLSQSAALRRRFERLVPHSHAHGRGTVVASIAGDLACGGELRKALTELTRWSSPWARWQLAWYSFLAGDAAAAERHLRGAELDRLIDPVALAGSRVLLAAGRGARGARDALCRRALASGATGGGPSAAPATSRAAASPARTRDALGPWCSSPLGLRQLTLKITLPPGARARAYLFPAALGAAAIARDPFLVYRNLSFVHRAADVQRGAARLAGVLPGRYLLVLKVWSSAAVRLEGAPEAIEVPARGALSLPSLRVTKG